MIKIADELVRTARERFFSENALRKMTAEARIYGYSPPSWVTQGLPAFERGLTELERALDGRSDTFEATRTAYLRWRTEAGFPVKEDSRPVRNIKTARRDRNQLAVHLTSERDLGHWREFWRQAGRSVDGCVEHLSLQAAKDVDPRSFCMELSRFVTGVFHPISEMAETERRWHGDNPTHEFGQHLMAMRLDHVNEPRPNVFYRNIGITHEQLLDTLAAAAVRPTMDESIRYLNSRVPNMGMDSYSDFLKVKTGTGSPV